MKKIFLVFVLLFFILPSQAIEEVVLKTTDENSAKTKYLFEETLTKHFDNSPVETMHFFGYYRGGNEVDIDSHDVDSKYNFYSINAGVNGYLQGEKTYYEARLRFNPQHDYSFFQYLPSNIYIANTSIPHHTVIVGNTRTPSGYEGGMSMTELPFARRAQISRNFGNIRKVGVRVKGKYDYLDYDLGGYNSDTYFRKFFPGAEFTGRVALKPMGSKNKENFGELKLGTSLTAGHNNISYTSGGVYATYEYKKLYADFEWQKADGYNGAKEITSKKAEGFYTTLGYKITPKIQLVTRYDQYKPNLSHSSDVRREYSTGINYFIKGQALKVMLNYVFCQNDLLKNSHKIILCTQILL